LKHNILLVKRLTRANTVVNRFGCRLTFGHIHSLGKL